MFSSEVAPLVIPLDCRSVAMVITYVKYFVVFLGLFGDPLFDPVFIEKWLGKAKKQSPIKHQARPVQGLLMWENPIKWVGSQRKGAP